MKTHISSESQDDTGQLRLLSTATAVAMSGWAGPALEDTLASFCSAHVTWACPCVFQDRQPLFPVTVLLTRVLSAICPTNPRLRPFMPGCLEPVRSALQDGDGVSALQAVETTQWKVPADPASERREPAHQVDIILGEHLHLLINEKLSVTPAGCWCLTDFASSLNS